MSKPGLSFGLNLAKKSGPSKPAPPKRKPMFGGDDDSDDDPNTASKPGAKNGTAITEFDDDSFASKPTTKTTRPTQKPGSKNALPPQPPTSKSKKSQMSMYGDLSSALESRKYQEAAEELDPSVYDYDGVYDSLKPEKKVTPEDAERRPKYMKSLLASAAVRKRDALIAEEKKIARERELEGDEFADKDKFVTEAYKKQQEENRRL
ncbi:coiled-coil domain-containing protein 55-domain containing protein, partial [Microdochium bolleyi]